MTSDDTLRAAYKTMATALMTSGESRLILERAITTRRRVRAGAAFGAATLAILGAVAIAGVVTRQGVDSMNDPTPAGHPSVIVPPVHIMFQGRAEFGGNLPVPRNPFGPYQNELIRAAERYANYSGARIIYQPQILIIYGTGQPSPEIASIINHPPKEVTARWVTVRYSRLQLERASNELIASIPGVMVTRYARDYGSIIVGIDGLPTNAAALQQLRDQAAGITDIPVTLENDPGGAVDPLISTPSN
jgi:hypothetical protein